MKHPDRDSKRRPQRLEASTLTTTPLSPVCIYSRTRQDCGVFIAIRNTGFVPFYLKMLDINCNMRTTILAVPSREGRAMHLAKMCLCVLFVRGQDRGKCKQKTLTKIIVV